MININILLIILIIIIYLFLISYKECFIDNVINNELVKNKLNIISNNDRNLDGIFNKEKNFIIIYENSDKCTSL
jgi:hypothetical protein